MGYELATTGRVDGLSEGGEKRSTTRKAKGGVVGKSVPKSKGGRC
jgi:hypothetical protein